jgi:hypothetical protein
MSCDASTLDTRRKQEEVIENLLLEVQKVTTFMSGAVGFTSSCNSVLPNRLRLH